MRAFIWRILKNLLFRLDAERAHHLILCLMRLGNRMGGMPLRIVAGTTCSPKTQQQVMFCGISFRSRVGLAAGFDKNAEVLTALPMLGFGFAEIGTVTPRPQVGNARPRLFRDPSRLALFNRMGFNGLGAEAISARLREHRDRLPSGFRVGVNVGKNKDTADSDAAQDYLAAVSAFRGLADYIVINVSSPNTPGLRALQNVEALKPIVDGVLNEVGAWSGSSVPVLLKLAPELFAAGGIGENNVRSLMSSAESWGIRGWVLTNTLAGVFAGEGGGWSGEVVRSASRTALQVARGATPLPIISVGGIMTVEEARARVEMGAELIQIYSGWIYKGPDFPAKIAKNLEY